jgi:hypothetical protein
VNLGFAQNTRVQYRAESLYSPRGLIFNFVEGFAILVNRVLSAIVTGSPYR